MHHLVFNKNSPYNFYKKSGHLVRTPITITLQPDERAVYQVAGSYRQEGSVWWADTGFIAQGTVANANQMGYDCLQALFAHGDWRMDWQNVASSHDPEMVWYQGAYATSAPNRTASLMSCEAYCQMAAYHFTVPSGLQSLDITSATLKFTNGGAIECYQSAANQSSNNKRWADSSIIPTPRTWHAQFGVLTSLGHIQTIAAAPHEEFDLASTAGTPKGARDLWGRTSTSADGGIPTLLAPVQCSVAMGASTMATMQNNMQTGFWVAAYFIATVSSVNDYRPSYVNSNNGYWACASLWGLQMQVELD